MVLRLLTRVEAQRPALPAPADAWWALGDAPVRGAETLVPLIDGRAAMRRAYRVAAPGPPATPDGCCFPFQLRCRRAQPVTGRKDAERAAINSHIICSCRTYVARDCSLSRQRSSLCA